MNTETMDIYLTARAEMQEVAEFITDMDDAGLDLDLDDLHTMGDYRIGLDLDLECDIEEMRDLSDMIDAHRKIIASIGWLDVIFDPSRYGEVIRELQDRADTAEEDESEEDEWCW